MHKDYETIRMELWKDVCVAYASSSNAVSLSIMSAWADRAVAEFDARFKPRMYYQMNCSPQIAKETNGR